MPEILGDWSGLRIVYGGCLVARTMEKILAYCTTEQRIVQQPERDLAGWVQKALTGVILI